MGKITGEQFVQAIVNNDDGLNNRDLASKIGISEQHFYNLRDKHLDDIRTESKKLVRQCVPEQIRNLKRNAAAGDTSAARLLLDLDNQYAMEDMIQTLLNEVASLKADRQLDTGTTIDVTQIAETTYTHGE